MNYEIEFSEQAEMDLRGIYEYIAFTLHAPINAGKQLERLEKNITELTSMPSCFKEYEKEPWRSRGLRMMTVDNFIVFYLPDEKKKLVTIIRIIYSGRDMNVELEENMVY